MLEQHKVGWSAPIGRRPLEEVQRECLIGAMRTLGAKVSPNKVYLVTIATKTEERGMRPWDSYVVNILAQEILGNDTQLASTGHSDT